MMTPDKAIEVARQMLSVGIVGGITRAGDVICQPSEERVLDLAKKLLSGDVKESE